MRRTAREEPLRCISPGVNTDVSMDEDEDEDEDDDDIGMAWHSITAGTPGLAYVIWQLQV